METFKNNYGKVIIMVDQEELHTISAALFSKGNRWEEKAIERKNNGDESMSKIDREIAFEHFQMYDKLKELED